MDIIEFKALEPSRRNLTAFQDIKNDIIGSEKQAYFDSGLIETFVQHLNPETDHLVLRECLAILNSFLIQFPQATQVFICYAQTLSQKLDFVLQVPN